MCLQAQSLASSLSTRQLLRICHRLSQYPNESITHAVNKACLSRFTHLCSFDELNKSCAKVIQRVNAYFRFLPRLARAALERSLDSSSIHDAVESDEIADLSCKLRLSNIYRSLALINLHTYPFNMASDFIVSVSHTEIVLILI